MRYKNLYARLNNRICREASRLLSPVEQRLIQSVDCGERKPTFIVGPARSGTTIVYQSLYGVARFSYFPNVATRFPYSPVLVSRALKVFGAFDSTPTSKSNFGKVEGWNSIAQAYEIWSRWFPRGFDESVDQLTAEGAAEMRHTIWAIQNATGRGFVNKWPGLSVYVNELKRIFPDALFVRVTRDLEDNALSVLKARQRLTGCSRTPISRAPVSLRDSQDRSPHVQVVAYVKGINNWLDDQLSDVEDQVFSVEYEGFCSCSDAVVEQFVAWYNQRSDAPIGYSRVGLDIRKSSKLDSPSDRLDRELIKEAISELNGSCQDRA